MEVQIEELGPCRKRLNVVIPAETVGAHVDEVFKSANQQIRMKGFRPGRIPRKVLEARMGEAILAQAKESLIETGFRDALNERKIEFVGTPKLDVAEGALDPEGPLSFSVEIDLKPEVEVGDVKSIEIEARPAEATEEEVESSLQELANSKRTLTVTDDEMEEGDFAKVDLRYLLDGEEVAAKQGLQIHARIPVAGTDPEEFQERLKGRKAGEKTSLPIHYPDTFEKEECRDKDGDLEIEIKEVLRFQAPPIDEEFAKSFNFESVEEMKEKLRERIEEEKRRREEARQEEEILSTLYTEHPFELPEGLVEEEVAHRIANLVQEMKRSGMPEEEAKKRAEEAKGEIRQGAEQALRNLFLSEALAKKHKLFVTETDIENELRRIASENQVEVPKVRREFEERNLFGELRLELMTRKVREWLRKTARIVDSGEGDES